MEQRLIDGNELRGIESLLNTDIIQASKEASWLMSQVLYDIDAMPTIDPETLLIVRELREKLEQVTAERNAAVEDLSKRAHRTTCKHGEHCDYVSVITGMPDCHACDEWEWRGPDGDHP